MKNEIRVCSKSIQAVSGAASVLITDIAPFNGDVGTFITNGYDVFVGARQNFDETRSGVLSIRFPASIKSKEHEYSEESGIFIIYSLIEELGSVTKLTPYPAVYGSGTVNVTFDREKGTFAATFRLKVQNDSTEPQLEAIGAFKDVKGLRLG